MAPSGHAHQRRCRGTEPNAYVQSKWALPGLPGRAFFRPEKITTRGDIHASRRYFQQQRHRRSSGGQLQDAAPAHRGGGPGQRPEDRRHDRRHEAGPTRHGPGGVPRVQPAGHHVRSGGDDGNRGGDPRRGNRDILPRLPQGQRLGRILPHRRTARGASAQGAVQHPGADRQQRRDRPEVPQDHSLVPHRGLVSRWPDLRQRRAEGHEDQPDHLRRRQLPGNLARLRDEGRRADRALPGLHVPGQGPAGDDGQGHGLGQQLLCGGGQRRRLRRRVFLLRPLGDHRLRRSYPG